MLIYVLDSDASALRRSCITLTEALPEARIRAFGTSAALLQQLEGDLELPGVIFMETHLPGEDGPALARRIMEHWPAARIVFLTDTDRFALTAWEMHVSGYVLKPLTPARTQQELEAAAPASRQRLLEVSCFGNFAAFSGGRALEFKRSKTLELLAYLVDRQGAACTTGELMAILWEDKPDTPSLRNYLRNLIHDLKTTLEQEGYPEVLVRRYNTVAIVPQLIACDYYDYLRMVPEAVARYSGEYMMQYSWAEATSASLADF